MLRPAYNLAASSSNMGFTVAVEVDHLPTACLSATTQATDKSRIVLIPNANPSGTVKSTLKNFIRENLFIPDALQCLTAPLYTMLGDQESVEDVYNRYSCPAEAETSDLHVDEENLTFFGKERGKTVELGDNDRLYERHLIDKSKLHLKMLPQSLSERRGRIFVETKDGTLPLLGMRPETSVSEIKRTLESMTGVPMSLQLLSSVGRVMHDEFLVEDFDGLHAIYEDSTLDLCKSGDTNAEQAHRRMAVQISILEKDDLTLIVQGRDTVQSVMQVIESRMGYAQWQQRLTFSGKALHEKKTLADYFIYPECTLQVSIFKNPSKLYSRTAARDSQELSGHSLDTEKRPPARKLRIVRTCRGWVRGTLTVPVLTTDTLYDVKRKIKRSLQPLMERNGAMQSPIKEQTHIDITPRSSPATARGNVNVCRSVNSASPSTEGIKLCAGNLSSSVQSTTSIFGNSTSLNSPSRNVRSPLSTGSSSQGQHPSPSVSGLPRRVLPSPSSLPPTFASVRRQLEEPSLGNGCKSQSVRRLQFESAAPPLSCASNSDSSENFRDSIGNLNEEMQDKRTFGAWVNGGIQTLKDQIRAQFADN